jgi:hypothetical protein
VERQTDEGMRLCVPPQDFLSLQIFNKEISFWAKQATTVVQFHEKMNAPTEKAPEK